MRNSEIYITGDVHGKIDIKKLAPTNFPEGKNLCIDDDVLVAGDFGCIWDGDKHDRKLLNWLAKRTFTTLFVDGNHENFNLLNSYPVEIWNGGKIHRINEKVIHLMRGQIFDISGIKFFTFGGATSCDKAMRRKNISWWEQELPSQEEMNEGLRNLEASNWTVDCIITHTAPTGLLGILKNKLWYHLDSDYLTDYLNEIYCKAKFKKWYFRHFHIDEEITKNTWVVYYDFVVAK